MQYHPYRQLLQCNHLALTFPIQNFQIQKSFYTYQIHVSNVFIHLEDLLLQCATLDNDYFHFKAFQQGYH